MRSYNAERRFKKAIITILAFNRFIESGKIHRDSREENLQLESLQIVADEVEKKVPEIKKSKSTDKSIVDSFRKTIGEKCNEQNQHPGEGQHKGSECSKKIINTKFIIDCLIVY
jgi:hypothetical protein